MSLSGEKADSPRDLAPRNGDTKELSPAEAKAAVAQAAAVSEADSLVPLAPSALLANASQESAAVRALLTQANLNRLRGQWEEAIHQCIEVLKTSPKSHTAHSLLGDIYRDQGKPEEAIRWYSMALDLKPNPTDEAKLKQQERERVRNTGRALQRAQGGSGVLALVPDGTPAGTAALLGLSPHRWLRGITIASAVFLALVVVILLTMQNGRRAATAVPRSTSEPAANREQSLLPPSIAAGVNNAGQTPKRAEIQPAGTGFAPDPGETVAPASHPSGPGQSPNNPALQPDAPASGNSGLSADFGSPAGRKGELALAGGMQIKQVEKDPASNSATITLMTPARSLSGLSQTLLVRNAFRAALTVFDADTTLTHATIFLQTQAGADAGEPAQAYAELDRFAAIQVNPDTDSLDRLTSLLRLLPRGGQDNAPSSSSSNE